MRHGAAKIVSLALDYVGDAAGVAVAAALLPGVSATLTGVAVVAAMLAVPSWAVGLGQDWLRKRGAVTSSDEHVSRGGCAFAVLMFAQISFLPLALVALAAAVVPGFEARGFWNTAATAAIVVAIPLALSSPFVYFRLRRRVQD